jgi:hypothetical protein
MYKVSLVTICLLCMLGCAAQSYEEYVRKAEVAYGKKDFDSCAGFFQKAFQLKDPKGTDLYNAAACNAKKGDDKVALELLNRSLSKGINISKLKIDPDLESLHRSKQWKKLIKKADKIQHQEFKTYSFPAYAKALAALWEKDQYWRFRLGKAYENNDTALANRLWKNLRPTDSVNLLELQSIIDKIGWPTNSKVGKYGASTAFLIIDHSPREVMEKYFPLLEAEALKGEASLSSYATMKDRILVNRGKSQVYGTQRYWNENEKKFVFFPIEDEKNVNARRKEVGLPPLKEF